VKTSTHSIASCTGGLVLVGVARLLDLWAFPTLYFSTEQFQDHSFLWRVTLSHIALAVPLGILSWGVLRQRPSIIVGVGYIVVSVAVLLGWLLITPNSRFDPFRRINAFEMSYANVCASLVFVAAVGVAALIRTSVSAPTSANQAMQRTAPRSDA
jgi:hypothetical protein